MRVRVVKPAFWSDSVIAGLPEPARLFYIGLWGLADDAGWLDGDVSEIAHALYGYDERAQREGRAIEYLGALIESGRVRMHDCGHLDIPTLPEHQWLGGPSHQVKTTWNRHLRVCVAVTGRRPTGGDVIPPRGSPIGPEGPRESPPSKGKGKGKGESKGKEPNDENLSGNGSPDDGADDVAPGTLKARLAAYGYDPQGVGRK